MKSTTIDFMPRSRAKNITTTFAIGVAIFFPAKPDLSPKSVYAATQVVLFQQGVERIVYVDPPTRVHIPSIGLDSPVEGLGVNEKGEMEVPPGDSDAVGWYAGGTVPGNLGSAVFDAHVFAAFSELHLLQKGADIYVTVGSRTLRFVVEDVQEYALAALSPQDLFLRSGGRYLNLITCAETYVPRIGTYDRRLVVYAALAA